MASCPGRAASEVRGVETEAACPLRRLLALEPSVQAREDPTSSLTSSPGIFCFFVLFLRFYLFNLEGGGERSRLPAECKPDAGLDLATLGHDLS